MTQPANDRIKQVTATGGEPTLPYDFQVELKTDMVVTEEDLVDVITTLVVDVDYVVNNLGVLGGGTITLDITKYPSGATLGHKFTLTGDTPSSRLADFQQTGPFFADTVNAEHDAFIQIVQQMQRDIDRCLRVPSSDGEVALAVIGTAAQRASLIQAYDSLGTPTLVVTPGGLSAVSGFMNTVLLAVNSAASRALHEAAGLLVPNVFTKTQTWFQGLDVASAAALTLGDGNIFDVTGTVTITSIVTKGVGTTVALQFDGILQLTHNSTDLVLPGTENIVTAAGDIAVFYEYATGDWRLLTYLRDPLDLKTEDTSTAVSNHTFTVRRGAKRVTFMFDLFSTSGTIVPLIQIGPTGGIETAGYVGSAVLTGTPAEVELNHSLGFQTSPSHTAATVLNGRLTLNLQDAVNNVWTIGGILSRSDVAACVQVSGTKPLAGQLEQIRVNLTGGQTIDAGSTNILVE